MAVLSASTSEASIALYPGDNLQAAIDSNPTGTTFVFTPGVYALTAGLIPRTNDAFIGMSGAILNGSKPLTNFATAGGFWYASGQTQSNPVIQGSCLPASYLGCQYADAVFYDDQMLWRVMSLPELGSGKFYFDYAGGRIYIADNPTGHKVEAAVATRGIQSWGHAIEGVRVQGLVIEKFATETAACALEGGNTWVIQNNEVRLNHGMGVCNGGVVTGNFVHHNGQMGMAGYRSTGADVEGNEIAFNNIAGFNPDVEGGGAKWMFTTNLTVRSNYVHDNNGLGLHTDRDNVGTLYEWNTVSNNQVAGIFHEVSFSATIRYNTVTGSGFDPSGGPSLWWSQGIGVLSSGPVEIYGNTVDKCLNGIGAIQINRGYSADGTFHQLRDLSVHGNHVIQLSNSAAGIVSDDPAAFTSFNNRFFQNHYSVWDLNAPFLGWLNRNLTILQWQSYGLDVDGIFDQVLQGPPAPPRGLRME
jgi:hypothetical protein